jgi:cytochrome c
MLKHSNDVVAVLWAGMAVASWAGEWVAPPDYRFQVEVLCEGMPQPLELEVAPDGRIFFNEIAGRLRIFKPASRKVVVAGEVAVFNEQENGFLGFALDPGFASNRWIYLYYSPKDYVGQRLSRFTMDGDTLVSASEKRMLEFGEQRRECCHHAGSVEFGPDGNLYVSTGDNTNPAGDSAGYAPLDERPGRGPFDAQKSAANTADLRGKIIRIRPSPDGGYTIPDGNLFPKDGSQGRPEIFVMGCRNPWRMSIDESTGIVYWGEVGPDAGGDGARGPRGYDEINQARRAGNYGWPYFVGNNFAYVDFDFATGKLGPKYDPLAPTNTSPNNTGAQVLPPAHPAWIYWPYGPSKEFPMLGQGGRTACAGPVFHFRPEFRQTGGFPEAYDRCLLFYDWQRPFLKWARMDEDSRLLGIEPFTGAVKVANDRASVETSRAAGQFVIQRPVDSQFGPDGCLYMLDYGETWGANKDSRLLKISYQWGNLAPVARAAAVPLAGREPLTVSLSSAGSKDFEGDPLQFEWRLYPGAQLFSTAANPKLTLVQPGNYAVELRVRDGQGGVGGANLPLIVGNSPPVVRFVSPRDGDFFTPGKTVPYRVFVRDAEDGDSTTFDEVFEPRTFVKATWNRGRTAGEAAEPGLALIKQNDCFNCHAVDRKIVGPPYLDVAEKYRGQAGALEASVQRVLHGSSGVWSEVPMLPHELLHADQVRTMVQWIYNLKPGQGGGGLLRGLTGEMKAPADEAVPFGILEASYTDAGRAPAASLSGTATVKLRSRRLEAELADQIHGSKVLGHFLGAIDDGHYARFAGLNLEDSGSVTFRVASAGRGGRIELRSGSTGGDLLAQVEVRPTGGWEKWIELTAPLKPRPGRADVFVVFVNPGQGGLMNLDWLRFNPK